MDPKNQPVLSAEKTLSIIKVLGRRLAITFDHATRITLSPEDEYFYYVECERVVDNFKQIGWIAESNILEREVGKIEEFNSDYPTSVMPDFFITQGGKRKSFSMRDELNDDEKVKVSYEHEKYDLHPVPLAIPKRKRLWFNFDSQSMKKNVDPIQPVNHVDTALTQAVDTSPTQADDVAPTQAVNHVGDSPTQLVDYFANDPTQLVDYVGNDLTQLIDYGKNAPPQLVESDNLFAMHDDPMADYDELSDCEGKPAQVNPENRVLGTKSRPEEFSEDWDLQDSQADAYSEEWDLQDAQPDVYSEDWDLQDSQPRYQ